ncbi:hypothetical protein GXW74_00835 [Roseomonas eburnea]|uniref:Uncharacterized protein n=1 Tax=Neoroseomonas eburnea TaxID=1346889 RepID=A0A9X9X5N1_9PROT|nr:hypothetical protein [Neoroseomonas eburnea]MBR0679017.1 hypothetical protein [Neoroseomonas eburnea]
MKGRITSTLDLLRGMAALMLLAAGLVQAGPARAQDADRSVLPISGLEGLVPLDPLTLRSMRGGQLTHPSTTAPRTGPSIRLWDEIARPPRPPLPQDGIVTSTSRASK